MEKMEPAFRLGMSAPEVLIELVRINSDIEATFFKTYIPTKNLMEEPFAATPLLFSVERLQRHNPTHEDIFWLKREAINLQALEAIIESFSEEERVLAVTSKVKTFSLKELLHIPMMDFSCEISAANLERIQAFLKGIGQAGLILETGRSYHFYGTGLLTKDEHSLFIGKCLLFTGYTDSRYIGHQLIDGLTALRISAGKTRSSLMPTVVGIITI